MSLFNSGLNWLEDNALTCPFRMITGCDCPGCGLQRSFFHCFRGDFDSSFEAHPAGIPMLLLGLFILINFWAKFKAGSRIINIWLIFIVILSLINYGFKLWSGTCCG